MLEIAAAAATSTAAWITAGATAVTAVAARPPSAEEAQLPLGIFTFQATGVTSKLRKPLPQHAGNTLLLRCCHGVS
jgi:hypothetical protein